MRSIFSCANASSPRKNSPAFDANDAVYISTPGKVISTIASRLYGVNRTPSNGLVICGLADSGNGYIAKATNSGEIVWEVTTTEGATLYDILDETNQKGK